MMRKLTPRGNDMTMPTRFLAFLILGIILPPVSAAELKLLPGEIALHGPKASQRLLVLTQTQGKVVGEVTGQAKFVSSNPAVAAVDAKGMVQPMGDGEAVI